MTIYEVTPLPLVLAEGMKATVKVKLAIAMRGIFSRVAVFTKAEFIQAAKDYLEWDESAHKDDKSRGTTASFTFKYMLRDENIEAIA